jgi:CheY-like chemotaxis protein
MFSVLKEEYDILMDVQMPICDGFESCNLIREYEKLHRFKPLMLDISGYDSDHVQNECQHYGIKAYIAGNQSILLNFSKPFPVLMQQYIK